MKACVKFLAVLLLIANSLMAYAELDPFTQQALSSFRDVVGAEQPAGAPSVEREAAYLMQVKNGLSLYRDGVLNSNDKQALSKLITQQLNAASAASNQPQELQALAEKMRAVSLKAKELLSLSPSDPNFASKMETYSSGLGYDAYRMAQENGIEQL